MAKKEVYDASLGEFVEIEVDNQPDPAELSGRENGVRMERNDLLQNSDWTVLSDAQLSDEQKTEAVTYRQALRDVPSQEGFPEVTFPDKPDFL